jgi:hypothetical protein
MRKHSIRHNWLAAASALLLTVATAQPLLADDACKMAGDATSKLVFTPVHMYMTEVAGFRKNQPKNSETIYTGGANGAIYIMVDGKWTRSRLTSGEMKGSRDEAGATSKQTCRYLRDEPVNGESAGVYSTHEETEAGKVDSTVWISKTRNLPLKSETDLDVGGAMGKSHTVVRYDYSNVQPPSGVK